jgi:hypothetical protein
LPMHFFRQRSPLTKAAIGMGRPAPLLSKEIGVSPLLCLLFEPCSRSAACTLQCFKTILEQINWLDCAVRPFGLDLPSVTVAQHDAENRLWGSHETHYLQKSSDGRISNSRAAFLFPGNKNPKHGNRLRAPGAQGSVGDTRHAALPFKIAARAASRLHRHRALRLHRLSAAWPSLGVCLSTYCCSGAVH